ncbi:MAG: recombinase family protein [Candidatus Gastranaerophilales bacterium]|nr:recombinase family protein [Candidatus Gastranaerophilales bacterium]
MKTIALYMRLSSEDAYEGESCSIANQRALLMDYVKSHEEFNGWNILEFCDDGYSGVSFERPGLQKLLSLAGGTVNCIMVKDFSRFGRNLVEVGDYLDQIFPFLGVRFIAVNEGYDSGQGLGSSVSLDVSLKALVYEMYSRDVSEKIQSVKHTKMRRGEYQGSIEFYGYKRSDAAKGKIEVDEPAADVVRRIFQMAAEGISPTDIAVALNRDGIPSPLMYRRENHTDEGHSWKVAGDTVCWTRENVRRTLCDERYTGRLVSHVRAKEDVSSKVSKLLPKEEWIIAEDAHEAIVTKEIFNQAQRVLRHCRCMKKPVKPYQKFRGLVKCAYCGRALTRSNVKEPYYYCITRRALPQAPCKEVYMEESQLEESLVQAIRVQAQLAQHDREVRSNGQTEEDLLRERLQECHRMVEKCKARQAAAFEDYAEGRIQKQEYLSWKKEISRQQEEAVKEYAKLSEMLAETVLNRGKETADLGRYAFIKELTREMLEDLVKAVKVSGKDTMEIIWNFKE